MNENPEGTPNPLNPNPAPVTPSTPATPATPAQPVQPVQPAAQSTPIPVNRPMASEPVMPTQPVQQPIQQSVAQTTEQPAQPVVSEEPKKKSKTSLIVTLIIFFVVLIGAAVAALVVYDPFHWFAGNDDRVPAAISKLFSESAPTNVKMNGVITLTNNDEEAAVSTVDIAFISENNVASGAQTANASVTVTFADESEFSFSADEVHTENGDLYLRVNDVAAALEEYTKALMETNCALDDNDDVNCEEVEAAESEGSLSMLDSLGIFEIIDNQWIRIEGGTFSTLTDFANIDTPAQCIIDAAGELSTYNTNVASLYQNNPFIEYSTENLTIGKKKDNLYLITINADKFTNFVNSLGNSGFMNSLYACSGDEASNEEISASEVKEILANVPAIYVEIDENNMFTRVYLKAASETASVIADIALSYPEKITITEPSEYIDINTLLSQLLSGFFGEEIVEMTE